MYDLEANRAVVRRFNNECIGMGNLELFRELLAKDFINHSAPPGSPAGPEAMTQFLGNTLRGGFPDLAVEIHDQVAEGDKVTTRKTIRGTHLGGFMGIPPTGKKVVIAVIDIVRVENGQYKEHWGLNSLSSVMAELKA
jgi:predicted ester cyclase